MNWMWGDPDSRTPSTLQPRTEASLNFLKHKMQIAPPRQFV